MQAYSTSNPAEARAGRRAQFAGRVTTLAIGGVPVTGFVHSVQENDLSSPSEWMIKVHVKELITHKPNRRSYKAR